jgi:hypothetical protein
MRLGNASPLTLAVSMAIGPGLGVAGAACGEDLGSERQHDTETYPAPALHPPAAPAPGAPDVAPGYTVTGVRRWYLIGNALTVGHDAVTLAVSAPAGTHYVDLWLDDGAGQRLDKTQAGFAASLDIRDLGPGDHRILLAADGSAVAFAKHDFVRSHPYYVSVTNDWDDPNNSDASLLRQEELHALHPELTLTHFVGPYTFTDPQVSSDRAEALAAWVRGMRDGYGDEIGLHIHPYCSFVDTTTVTCHTEPSFAYDTGDTTGYTVFLSLYSEAELGILLAAASALFDAHDLGRPTSFRAGGWTATIPTLKALASAGFVADGSAANWHFMEEWKDVAGSTLYAWNAEHWATIDATSQPYYPSEADILAPGSPSVGILEVPDNSLLVDYVTAAEMIGVFDANWSGGALAAPKVWSIGYHPPNFSESFKHRIDDALSHADEFLASADAGPVVYSRMSDLALVWPAPDE